jgi:hypothetical protein
MNGVNVATLVIVIIILLLFLMYLFLLLRAKRNYGELATELAKRLKM